ncbi:MAG TPA: N-acetylmuramoyl-L-alanine amidase [Verrucomicrobiae bacterium]|nr:N-acetylmuramoyl-L-alanine amidase [Verrucomicrobiae bacterium]
MKLLSLRFFPFSAFTLLACALAFCAGCSTFPPPGTAETRQGDEIVAAGQFFHTGTRVVLWMDPGGYDAYRVQRRFAPFAESGWDISHATNKFLESPNRYGMRIAGLTTNQIETVRGGGWDLPSLQKVVDQFVLHFDVAGTSRRCFATLQDARDLSVHFMCDEDGTIYQTLDLKEAAWHATISNNRSVGIEIANIGSYPVNEKNPLGDWYRKDADGKTVLTIPDPLGAAAVRTPGFVGHPARPDPVYGNIQGEDLVQYDFTPQQYAALTKLTATLCKVFPRIKCQYPVDADGKLIPRKLTHQQWLNYHGVLGHYHIQTDKVDPGPAFQWDLVIGGAQKILRGETCHPLLTPRQKDLALHK